MELTTGAILRRITRTDLSVSAHKLATLILDGIAWKDGYNGLPRGTAAFTLGDLAHLMGVSRQYLHVLLGELAKSGLRLIRQRIGGAMALWQFRFGCCEDDKAGSVVSRTGDRPLYKEDSNKNVFSGMIVLDRAAASRSDRWLAMISAAKTALPCRGIDSQHIWERFRAFNLQRGHAAVPAGYLLGFMRKWRPVASASAHSSETDVLQSAMTGKQRELQALIALAPVGNRQFHERDLRRRIGDDAYQERLASLEIRRGCNVFVAKLVLHGKAVQDGELLP